MSKKPVTAWARIADTSGYDIKVAEYYKLLGERIEIPEFLSSHPVTKDRILYIDKMIKTNSFRSVKHPKLTYLFNKIKDRK